VTIEIRTPREEQWRAAMLAASTVFAEDASDESLERFRKTLVRERFYAAYDGDLPVGTAADFPFTLTVPGGELAAGGVTWVTVLPTHRRQGVLTQMMRKELDDLHERGEPLAVLWASEAAIYGRFGYGMAAPHFEMAADTSRFAFRNDPGRTGSVRMTPLADAIDPCMHVYERVRPAVPGFTARAWQWWEEYRLADPEEWRRGASPKYAAIVELDGEPAAYAIYRIKSDWESGFSKSVVRVVEALAASPAAEREVWRFVFGIDLIVRVDSRLDPASPLVLMVVDARSLQLRLSEGLWLRLVDLQGALSGRSYATDDDLVLDVSDDFCPWNAGRWRVGGSGVERTGDDAELELDVADLASAYLGAFSFTRLLAAQRVRELKDDAIARADALFRTPRPPYCPEDF
jgi:predicted acetyltransferase